MFSTPEFKVGVLVVAISSLIGVMSLRVSEGPGVLGGSKDLWFDIKDAGGLVKNSAVKMAGIKVGVIEDIELHNGEARVRLKLRSDVPVSVSGSVEVRADGILGDKHVELLPGKVGDPMMADGQQIQQVISNGSLDDLVKEVTEIAGSIKKLARSLNEAVEGQGDSSTTVGRILINLDKLTKDLSEISGDNKQKIGEIVDQVNSITRKLDEVINESNMASFENTLKNIEDVTDKVSRGEGTIGRLVNDEDTIDGINLAVDNVNQFLGGISQLQTSIDFHSEYLGRQSETKSYLSVRLQPGLDRYWEIGVVDDPQGVIRAKDTTLTDANGNTTTTSEEVTHKNKLKFTALFAKNFYNFTIKGGLLESAGGFGIDYYLLDRKLRFSVEMFDFGDFRLRTFARYQVLRGIYLIGGGNDMADKENSSGFFGAGLFLTNDDLRLLATSFL